MLPVPSRRVHSATHPPPPYTKMSMGVDMGIMEALVMAVGIITTYSLPTYPTLQEFRLYFYL